VTAAGPDAFRYLLSDVFQRFLVFQKCEVPFSLQADHNAKAVVLRTIQ